MPDTHRLGGQQHRRHLGDCRQHPIRISRQIPGNRTHLTKPIHPAIRIQPHNNRIHRTTLLPIRHIISHMARQRQLPNRKSEQSSRRLLGRINRHRLTQHLLRRRDPHPRQIRRPRITVDISRPPPPAPDQTPNAHDTTSSPSDSPPGKRPPNESPPYPPTPTPPPPRHATATPPPPQNRATASPSSNRRRDSALA